MCSHLMNVYSLRTSTGVGLGGGVSLETLSTMMAIRIRTQTVIQTASQTTALRNVRYGVLSHFSCSSGPSAHVSPRSATRMVRATVPATVTATTPK